MSTGRKCADIISASFVPCGQPSVFGVRLLSHSLPALTVTNLSQITCSAFYKQTNKYGLILKIAQTRLLPNNQSDAQEFDGCITSANQKMSYLMDVSHQPIRRQVIFDYQLANQDWFIYSLYHLIWPVNLGYSYLKHLQPHNWKADSRRYK
jgi:hypothetical protein